MISNVQTESTFGNTVESPCAVCGGHPLLAVHDSDGGRFNHHYRRPERADDSMLHDTQPQHEQVDQLWSMLQQSHGSTADLLAATRGLMLVTKGLLRHVDELQGEVGELKARLNQKGDSYD